MNKYKLISISAAAMIIVAGCIYLAAGASTLGVVLGICALSLCVMGGANAAELKSSGVKGFPSYLPAICFGILAAFVVAAGIYWYMTK